MSFVIPGVIAKSTLRTSPTCRAGTAISSECSPSKIVVRHVTDWIASSISAWMHINYPYNCRRVGRFCVTPPITPPQRVISFSVSYFDRVRHPNEFFLDLQNLEPGKNLRSATSATGQANYLLYCVLSHDYLFTFTESGRLSLPLLNQYSHR